MCEGFLMCCIGFYVIFEKVYGIVILVCNFEVVVDFIMIEICDLIYVVMCDWCVRVLFDDFDLQVVEGYNLIRCILLKCQ